MPAIAHDLSLTPAQAGPIGSVTLASMLFGALVAGRLTDRYGRVRVTQASLAVFGIGSLLCALAPGRAALAAARFLTSLGLGVDTKLHIGLSDLGRQARGPIARESGGGMETGRGMTLQSRRY